MPHRHPAAEQCRNLNGFSRGCTSCVRTKLQRARLIRVQAGPIDEEDEDEIWEEEESADEELASESFDDVKIISNEEEE